MLSGGELAKHTTSIRYRKLLADYYDQPADVLFAHQDQQLTLAAETPRLLVGHHDLREAMTQVVRDAQDYLAVVGSRSRDAVYLEAIEAVLTHRPELIHDRSLGLKTLHIGIVEDDPGTPERFVCASESTAVVSIPSLTSSEAFDSGVLFESRVAERLIDHARQVYAGARKVETEQALLALPTARS